MTEKLSPTQLALYYSPTCPFCHRVLNALQGMGFAPDLDAADAGGIALKDKSQDQAIEQELIAGGGKKTVPCLRIERDGNVEWLYESLDIIAFIDSNVAH